MHIGKSLQPNVSWLYLLIVIKLDIVDEENKLSSAPHHHTVGGGGGVVTHKSSPTTIKLVSIITCTV